MCCFLNQIIHESLLSSSIPTSEISSWDWCLIDWHNQPHIVKQARVGAFLPLMSYKGWTAIYHWIWPITPPFGLVPMEGAECRLNEWGGHRPLDHPSFFQAGRHGLGQLERLFNRPALAPRAGHLCYKMPPSFMEWDTPVTTWPSTVLLWIAPLCYLVSPMEQAIFIFT